MLRIRIYDAQTKHATRPEFPKINLRSFFRFGACSNGRTGLS